ncbi:3-phosphoshikimate 1-carboxyvinyltransferase [Ornithinibacillus contaminans]|uniref:3-phosphoshikimate 1-carboxyvinyltransferase n=1 Tax=Ornithinibacillus contaminans TaxID=694055 RepID=UPI00064DBB7F|nr:3-phosphoshikimate 1-carboxyvinyltransferase [Ornithinibacillus contaminans]
MKRLPKKDNIVINGEITVPGDKSISHRAVMLGALAEGVTMVENFLVGDDCLRTVKAFQSLGVSIKRSGTTLEIYGKGLPGLTEPTQPLYFGNSGTTARLMLGILAALPFTTTVYGDSSLSNRPMARVIKPLRKMGATILGRANSNYLPLAIQGGNLQSITYDMPVKSAQVKSALLFAALQAKGRTSIQEIEQTRNHTENMLTAFGANLVIGDNTISLEGKQSLQATNVFVPGDISSAAFMLAAAAMVPNSTLAIKHVGLNPTRTGILDVLQQMGAEISVSNYQFIGGEAFGDVKITNQSLHGVVIEGEIIPRLIDELPILALLATQAEGKTIIRNAEELRVKETDRIACVVDVLSTLGARIEATEDGMIIYGKTRLTGGTVSAYHDHRIAMMIVIASLITEGEVSVDDLASIAISYPTFMEDLQSIIVTE